MNRFFISTTEFILSTPSVFFNYSNPSIYRAPITVSLDITSIFAFPQKHGKSRDDWIRIYSNSQQKFNLFLNAP